ncbi:hypothetical protein [Embleya sp. NBC_00896]|nr:hypothetical protein OG928_03170 [Embleya sp. NBC_00896]
MFDAALVRHITDHGGAERLAGSVRSLTASLLGLRPHDEQPGRR